MASASWGLLLSHYALAAAGYDVREVPASRTAERRRRRRARTDIEEFLADELGGFRPEAGTRLEHLRLGFPQRHLVFPALLVSAGQLDGGDILGIEDGGHQAEDLRFPPARAVGDGVLDHPHRNVRGTQRVTDC